MPEEKTDHDRIVEIHSVLLGSDGHKGLCQDFEDHKKTDTSFRNTFYKFRLWSIIIFILLAVAYGFSAPEIVKALILGG